MKSIALIPARGGSKRIPHKNIKSFCGKPIIAYSICLALESGLFDDVVVSTDSEHIAQIASKYGASVPFLRPSALSDDYASTASVAVHTADSLGLAQEDLLCVIYPTAPLLQKQSLMRAYEIMKRESGPCYVFGAVAYDYSPFRSFVFGGDGTLDGAKELRLMDSKKGLGDLCGAQNEGEIRMLFPEHYATRSQDLPQVYHDAGQFYFGRAGAWRENRPIFGACSQALVLPRYLVQDIDTLDDWAAAEEKFIALGNA